MQLPIQSFTPINRLKPLMLLNLLRPSTRPKPLIRILMQQLQQQILTILRNIRMRKLQILTQNILKQRLTVIIIVRWNPKQHLIQKHTKQIPVYTLPMPFSLQHLRRQVGIRAAETFSVLVLRAFLGQPEICQHRVSFFIKHDIVWFEVSE